MVKANTREKIMKQMEQFLRIANARLRKVYPNKQQRRAWAAKMYARWIERKTFNDTSKGIN